jgi:thymidylate synthase ThyX
MTIGEIREHAQAILREAHDLVWDAMLEPALGGKVDVQDFVSRCRPIVERNCGTFLRTYKSPFGFSFQMCGAKIRVFCTGDAYSMKVVK